MPESKNQAPAGVWKPRPLQALYYGPSIVQKHLKEILPSKDSKAFIITGNSLATKTPLVKNIEDILGSQHAGTFSKIGQHAPVKQLDEATELVKKDSNIDTVISLGGGSPIDSAKVISYRVHQSTGRWLHHISIPTTLSAAECTQNAGYTETDGVKTSLADPGMAIATILYDSEYAKHTPSKLWISTGMRAMDHAMETVYHPMASEFTKVMALQAAEQLFKHLPIAKKSHPEDEGTSLQLFLAAYMSLGFLGTIKGRGLGLSHTLGYALGSPYQIPHGETSCMTLGRVVKMKTAASKDDAHQIARMLSRIGGQSSGDDSADAQKVGDMIIQLVKELGLDETLTQRGVNRDQADLITQRATGGLKDGPLYDAVRKLVDNLW